MEDDNRYPWQKGLDLLSPSDKVHAEFIYPDAYRGKRKVYQDYVAVVDMTILKMGEVME